MTVPADAYVSFTAGEAARTILDAAPNPEGAIVMGRTHGFLVIVARGPIAEQIEKALEPKAEEPKIELCRLCIRRTPAVSGGLCARHAPMELETG